jgi:hypothetical protein
MSYKEIGDLVLNENMQTGIIRSKTNKKKTLLYPDGERLIYNYTIDPHLKDAVIYRGNDSERMLFIGKNVFIDYNGDTGNFYCENPRYVLKNLLFPLEDGGLNLSHEDLFCVCESMKCASIIDDSAFIVSKKKDNSTILFRYNFSNKAIDNINPDIQNKLNNALGDGIILSKIIKYDTYIYFFTLIDGLIKVFTYNTYNGDFSLHETLTEGLSQFNSDVSLTHAMAIFVDNGKLFILACVNNNALKVYDFFENSFNTVQGHNANLSGKRIINAFYNYDGNQNEKIIVLTDDNTITLFSGEYSSSLLITKVYINGSYGVNGIIRYKKPDLNAVYGVFYNNADGSTGLMSFSSNIAAGGNILLNASGCSDETDILKIFSNKMYVSGFLHTPQENLNVVYGSYEEDGIRRILIKQLDIIKKNNKDCLFVSLGGLEKSSSIINIEGSAYGDMQLSRLRIMAEGLEHESNVIPLDTEVYFREYKGDNSRFTTGSFLWKQLYNIGIPFNTHVETVGRIIMDGYVIPISKVFITKNINGNDHGDVLLTFDKYFNPNVIGDSLHEHIMQYPGALFFKNNGFLSDAVISTSPDMEGGLTYNDCPQGDLFDEGIHAVTASIIIDNNILILAGAYGCIASININTRGYTNINGKSHGDEPPPYYKNHTASHHPDNIKAFIRRNDKIYYITNRGFLYRTRVGSNDWENIPISDTSRTENEVHYLNNRSLGAYTVKDNLLVLSWPFGGISSFDLDSEVYTEASSSNNIPHTLYEGEEYISTDIASGYSLTVKNRIYFVGDLGIDSYSKETLCWFDLISKTFGFAKNPPSAIFKRTKNRVDLVNKDDDIYLLVSNDSGSSLIKYDKISGEYTVLKNSPYKHSRCGIYLHDDKIYALFGINGNKKYIQVYSIANDIWVAHEITNQAVPILYNAKGFIKTNEDDREVIHLFWGSSVDGPINEEVCSFSKLIQISLINDFSLNDTIDVSINLDAVFSNKRFIGYSLNYNPAQDSAYIIGGYNTESGNKYISNKVYRFNNTNKAIDVSFDYDKDTPVWNSIYSLKNQNICEIGGYKSYTQGYEKSSIDSNIKTFILRKGLWDDVRSLAYDPNKELANNAIPVITSMKVIWPGNMLVISYMDGGVGSIDLNTGRMIPPSSREKRSLSCIYAPAGLYSDKGAYTIYEDEQDVVFICVNGEFKFAKEIGVFFRGEPKDSSDISFNLESEAPYPMAGASQAAIGKYIVYLNGYNEKAADWRDTLHNNISILDTSTGKYAVLASEENGTIRKKYNGYSHYYNGYIFTFGGIFKEERFDNETKTYVTDYIRRGIIERYDLVTGNSTIIPTEYGPNDIYAIHNKNTGINQINQFNPITLHGKRDDKSIIASYIIANNNPDNNDGGSALLSRMFFFDLISGGVYKGVTVIEPEFPDSSAILLCEREKTGEIYFFRFSVSGEEEIDKNEQIFVSVYKSAIDEDNNLSIIPLSEDIKVSSPIGFQNFISGLSNVIYNSKSDLFIIPGLQRSTPSTADKAYLAATIDYSFDPMDNTINEINRDASNPIRIVSNTSSIPLDKGRLDSYIQYNPINLMQLHKIDNEYAVINPLSEVMRIYDQKEMLGHERVLIEDEENVHQKALYKLFTYKETSNEIAEGVNPGRGDFAHYLSNSIVRAVAISSGNIEDLNDVLYDAGIIHESGKSTLAIIKYDFEMNSFSLVQIERIGVDNIPYSSPSVVIDNIIWVFLNYAIDSFNDFSIISYDFTTNTLAKHVYNVSGNGYSITTENDLPRCIVDKEKKIVHIPIINRSSASDGFTGAIYSFSGFNYFTHIGNMALMQKVTVWDTLIPAEEDYYTGNAVNSNGYVHNNKIILDIFNGKDRELSYTSRISLDEDGFPTNDIKIKNSSQFIRGFPLKNSVYMKTIKGGVIQDIIGYIISDDKGHSASLILAVDSSDIIKYSKYEETRSYIVFDRLNKEIPLSFASLKDRGSSGIITYNDEELFYFEVDKEGNKFFNRKKIVKGQRYKNLRNSGYLPTYIDIGGNKIVDSKSIAVDEENIISSYKTNGNDGLLFYKFNTKNKINYAIDSFRYFNDSKEIDSGVDILIADEKLYLTGMQKENNNCTSIIIFDLSSGEMLDIKSISTISIINPKTIYNSIEKAIYIIGGSIYGSDVVNNIIFKYDISLEESEIYIQDAGFEDMVTDAYFNEELNTTFIHCKSQDPSSQGRFKGLDHVKKQLASYTSQINPIASSKMVQTKGKAFVYINSGLNTEEDRHYIFDPVSLNYISSLGNDARVKIENNSLKELIPINNKSVFMGVKSSDSPLPDLYSSDFSSGVDEWDGQGMNTANENSKLKCVLGDLGDPDKVYLNKSFKNDDIRNSDIIIALSGDYSIRQDALCLVYHDGEKEYLNALLIDRNTYKIRIKGRRDKKITSIRFYPSHKPLPGRVIYIDYVVIKRPVLSSSSDSQWAIGAPLFKNAVPAPINLTATKRLFSYNGELYVYGLKNEHEICVYNKALRNFDAFSESIHSLNDVPDSSYLCSKVYLDGTVRFCFVNPSEDDGEIKITFILFGMESRTVIETNTLTVPIEGCAANEIDFSSLSIKSLWASKYFICTITSGFNTNYLIKIDLSNMLVFSYNVGNGSILNSKSSLEWFYDRVISIGGSYIDSSGNLDNHLDENYKIASFTIDGGLSSSVKRLSLPISSGENKKSSFFSIKSAKKISSIFVNALSVEDKQSEAVFSYDDAGIDAVSGSLALSGGNGEENGDRYSPYVDKLVPNDFKNQIQAALFEDARYLSDHDMKPYHIPYKDNIVLFGLYDKLRSANKNIDALNYDNAVNLRAGTIEEDLIGIYSAYTYLVYIYSGATRDSIITYDKSSSEIVSKVSFERDYGSVITKVEELDVDKFILIYDNAPAIGTLIIHKDGNITVKRYDGRPIGRVIDQGNNGHTIQEVDLTLLFDTESSEYGLRKGTI